MATIARFNPPPNWPEAPPGWTPPQGWQPDPSWGPVPEGWSLWINERANPRAWRNSCLSSLAIYAVVLAIAFAVSRGALGAEGAGALAPPYAVAFVVVGLIAYNVRGRWAVWVYPLAVLGIGVVLTAITTLNNRVTA